MNAVTTAYDDVYNVIINNDHLVDRQLKPLRALSKIPVLFFADSATIDYMDIDDAKFFDYFEKINTLTSKTQNSQDDLIPNEYAISWARKTLEQLMTDGFTPTTIVSSAEGGVALCFVNNNKYADIECLNTGEILGVISNKRDRPIVWKIEPDESDIARATNRISEFIKLTAPEKNDSRTTWKR